MKLTQHLATLAVGLPLASCARYIVTLNDGVDVQAHTQRTARAGRRPGGAPSADIDRTYEGSFNGYAGEFDEEVIRELEASDEVMAIEPDQEWGLFELVTQEQAPYHLHMISHRQLSAAADTYLYDDSAGAGGTAYILDTGIYAAHNDFGGRARLGYNAVPSSGNADTTGHGTHVAGTVGATTYGVAKAAELVGVKVFSGTTGTVSSVLDGYAWAVNQIVSSNATGSSVINMSLGGGRSDSVNMAVRRAAEQGIVTVAAAGNQNLNASQSSPASAPEAITVGSVGRDFRRARDSNWGVALDVFAPGVGVTSLGTSGPDATRTESGTSMAAPHVAGLVLYLQALEGLSGPQATVQRLQQLATRDAVIDPRGSVNLLVFNGAGE